MRLSVLCVTAIFTLAKCLHCVLAMGINLAFDAAKLSRPFLLIFSTNLTIWYELLSVCCVCVCV